tara:strand:+ start:38374 stop:38865 length:492 start_codon:yes stop_codon:yes gene_type:complete
MINMHNVLQWNTKLAPTPMNKQMVLEKPKFTGYAYICFSTQVESVLQNSNLVLKAESYCFKITPADRFVLTVKSDVPYFISSQLMEFKTESGTASIDKFKSIGLFSTGRVSLDFKENRGYAIRNEDNSVIYAGHEPNTVEFNSTGWFAIENIDDRPLMVDIKL